MPRPHQPVIGVIEDRLDIHLVKQLVECLGAHSLECGVRIPTGTYAVDDFRTCPVLVKHLVDGADIVLTIAVHGDDGICVQSAPPINPARRAF